MDSDFYAPGRLTWAPMGNRAHLLIFSGKEEGAAGRTRAAKRLNREMGISTAEIPRLFGEHRRSPWRSEKRRGENTLMILSNAHLYAVESAIRPHRNFKINPLFSPNRGDKVAPCLKDPFSLGRNHHGESSHKRF